MMAKKKATRKKAAKKKAAKRRTRRRTKKVGPVTDVTASRAIDDRTRWMLWGKAAGRCEFSGCNRLLWKSPVTQEQVNIAEAAHIYAYSTKGPRGNKGVDEDKLNDVDNLMLACHDCHKTMDQDGEGERYSVELLQAWKRDHEYRVETVTGIDPKKSSHVVLYGANIGVHGSPLVFNDAAQALFPDFYPADRRPVELSTANRTLKDKEKNFWQVEIDSLETQFDRKVKQLVESGEINHISVFGLAPQPLLVLLGCLLGDITPAEVYQRYREPTPSWNWPENPTPLALQVNRPTTFEGQPALVIALTAPVTDDRITLVLGDDASIWTITSNDPAHDQISSREDLSAFRKEVRKLLDEIKEKHGQDTPLHIFPVAGNSVSIELGRIRMPKAMMPWVIYDQINDANGFVSAIQIK